MTLLDDLVDRRELKVENQYRETFKIDNEASRACETSCAEVRRGKRRDSLHRVSRFIWDRYMARF